MSFTDFGDYQRIKQMDTDEEAAVGDAIIFGSNQEISKVRTKFYKHGTGLGGSDRLQLKIYTDIERTKLLYSSDLFEVAHIDNPSILVTEFWLGMITFTFSPAVSVNQNHAYYASIAVSNYTRNGEDFYFGFGFDGPKTVNTVNSQDPPVLLEFYKLER